MLKVLYCYARREEELATGVSALVKENVTF